MDQSGVNNPSSKSTNQQALNVTNMNLPEKTGIKLWKLSPGTYEYCEVN